jgi:hypothetical protein
MTMRSAMVRPVNSIVFISDPSTMRGPEWVDGAMVWGDSTSILVCCFPEIDGPTRIVLGAGAEVDPGEAPAFDGLLDTFNRKVVITTVDEEVVLSADVRSPRTRVRVWLSHPQWPETVTVGLD